MNSAQSRRRGVARLMAVCAVLFGLFLMHGAPATAASGCHESVSAPAPVHDDHGGHFGAAMAPSVVAGSAHIDPQVMAGEHGALCVATPPRGGIPLPVVWLLAVVVLAAASVWALLRRRLAAGGTGRRGPPDGRDLLLKVCVARN
ncbi:DUF6153 family protein [Streptomyces sp. NPDC050448]|uniref:DUF6153 family protein n=1 Tax=Streptomyces sp. NPDC050448 TaxID=3155404 RepID=UPI0034299B41